MPAPQGPATRRRIPSTMSLAAILALALLVAATTIRWAAGQRGRERCGGQPCPQTSPSTSAPSSSGRDGTTGTGGSRHGSFTDPEFIAWAVAGTEDTTDGFTPTRLRVRVSTETMVISGHDASGAYVIRRYSTNGFEQESRSDPAEDQGPAGTSIEAPLPTGAEFYERLVIHLEDADPECRDRPGVSATSTWSQQAVYSQFCSYRLTRAWLNETQIPLLDSLSDATAISEILDQPFAVAAPDRPVTRVVLRYGNSREGWDGCSVYQDDAEGFLVTTSHLTGRSDDAITTRWTSGRTRSWETGHELSRDEIDPTVIETIMNSTIDEHGQLAIGWNTGFEQFTIRARSGAEYALDGTRLN
ncbi:hypothetical protein [Propionibacterium australiense]|nr:hypothetical protein [Propionibacterium australiense]